MTKTSLLLLIITTQVASADLLTSSQRFLGLGDEYPSNSEEGEEIVASQLDQAPYSPADSDLGVQQILLEQPERFPVIFSLETTVYYTDEPPATLPNDGSWIFALDADIAYRPHLVNGWFADVALGYDFLRFDESVAIDYENMNFRLGVYKNMPDWDETLVFARYEAQRLTTNSLGDGDYNAQRFRLGLQKTLWEAPRHMLNTTLSYAYEWTARPEALERDEVSLNVSYRYALTDKIYLIGTARAYWYDYSQGGREDWAYVVSTELQWQVRPNLSVSTIVMYDKNDSNTLLGANDTEAWTAGLGVGVNYKF